MTTRNLSRPTRPPKVERRASFHSSKMDGPRADALAMAWLERNVRRQSIEDTASLRSCALSNPAIASVGRGQIRRAAAMNGCV